MNNIQPTIAADIRAMMHEWDELLKVARAAYPENTDEQNYQMCAAIYSRALKIHPATAAPAVPEIPPPAFDGKSFIDDDRFFDEVPAYDEAGSDIPGDKLHSIISYTYCAYLITDTGRVLRIYADHDGALRTSKAVGITPGEMIPREVAAVAHAIIEGEDHIGYAEYNGTGPRVKVNVFHEASGALQGHFYCETRDEDIIEMRAEAWLIESGREPYNETYLWKFADDTSTP